MPTPSLAELGLSLRKATQTSEAPSLPLSFGNLDEALPDGGLPRGAVVEIASPYGLARASSIALAACRAAQADARLRGEQGSSGAWCAWLEARLSVRSARAQGAASVETSLFAPAVARAGVDLNRLLVVRPTAADLSRIAARAAQSHVFSVIVIDLVGVPGHHADHAAARLDRWVGAVRRLAMAVEGTESTVILLTDALAPRAVPLPVALRLEIDRPAAAFVRLTVAKDRRGRVGRGMPVTLPNDGFEDVTPAAKAVA